MQKVHPFHGLIEEIMEEFANFQSAKALEDGDDIDEQKLIEKYFDRFGEESFLGAVDFVHFWVRDGRSDFLDLLLQEARNRFEYAVKVHCDMKSRKIYDRFE